MVLISLQNLRVMWLRVVITAVMMCHIDFWKGCGHYALFISSGDAENT